MAEMEAPGAWADEICLSFLADVVKRPLIVLAWNIPAKNLFEQMYAPTKPKHHGKSPIYLYYNGDTHYDLVDEARLDKRAVACSQGPGAKL